MATTKEVAQKKKTKSTSAPASPPKMEQPHRRSRTVPDAHHGDISSRLTEQTMPRYLKPTISSCHDTNCHYPKHQQSPKPSAADPAAGKRIASRKPAVDKAHSPTSTGQKPSASSAVSSKERATRSIASIASSSSTGKTAAPSTRSSLDKTASKTPAGAKTTLPMRKTKSLPKLNPKTSKDKEAVKSKRAASATSVDKAMEPVEVSPGAGVNEHHNAGDHPSHQSTEVEDKSKHDEKTEVEVDGGEVDAGERLKFKEPEERNVAETVGKVEAKSLAFKKQDGSGGSRKESPPAYNNVIEEAANKLAARRSKVMALAGAFESVISLQKPERQEEVSVEKCGTGGGGGGGKEKHQEKDVKNGGNGSEMEMEIVMTGETGQQSQQVTEKSTDGQDDVEVIEGNDVANVTIESMEELTTTDSPK